MALSAQSRSLARSAARQVWRDWSGNPNVTHVSVGWKIVGGVQTRQLALKIHVLDKRDVAPSRQFPKVVEHKGGSFPTDVIEITEHPTLAALGTGDALLASHNDIGTSGLVFTKHGRSYVLTNAHVVSDVANGGRIGPVGIYNGPAAPAVRLGDIAYCSVLSPARTVWEDAAVVAVDDAALVAPYRISYDGRTVDRYGQIQPRWGPYWFASDGELFTCDDAELVPNATLAFGGVTLTYGNFWQLRMGDGRMRTGLSGSLLCRRVGQDVVATGLVFGMASPDFVWVFQFVGMFDSIYAKLP